MSCFAHIVVAALGLITLLSLPTPWVASAFGQGRLNLPEGIRLAMQHNESLQMAGKEEEQAKQQTRETRGGALPQLEASMNYDRNWLLPAFIFDTPTGRQTVRIGTDNSFNGTLRIRQPVYHGGKLKAGLKASRRLEERAGQASRQLRQEIRERVEVLFYDAQLAHELLEVRRAGLESARENVRQVDALYKAGRVSNFDVLRAGVQVAILRADSIRSQNQWKLAMMDLKDIVGLNLEEDLVLEGDFRETSSLPLADLSSLQRRGQQQRPEVRQLDHLIAANQGVVGVEAAEARPSLDLVADAQVQFQSDTFDLKEDNVWRRSWSTGVELQVPLFDGRQTGARVSRSRLEVERLQLQAGQLKRRVRLEIHSAWLRLNDTGEELNAQLSVVAQAQEGLAVARSRYANGSATQLEVTDAQLVLIQAQTGYATARKERAQALVRLERAVGVLGE
jgi:outer membrane protein TolC